MRIYTTVIPALFVFCLGCQTGSSDERGRFTGGGGKADDVYSCAGHCGEEAPGGCWCDDQCDGYGDCCADKVEICDGGGQTEPTKEELLAELVQENLDRIIAEANAKFADLMCESCSVQIEADTLKCLA